MSPEDDTARNTGRGVDINLPEQVLNDPIRRRAWLLSKALESLPLDRALEFARSAEAFITGSLTERAKTTPKLRLCRAAKNQNRRNAPVWCCPQINASNCWSAWRKAQPMRKIVTIELNRANRGSPGRGPAIDQ
jgi:hypothetical protein